MRFRILALACILFAALPVSAEVAKVTGGEHKDFTRLVVEARDIGNWRFGRAVDGYELEFGNAVTAFDVTQAFEKIPRDRITALWRDPKTGRLRFSLACACHAIAFEFRSGIVVIDIKSGPPPEGSGFESPIDPASPEPADLASGKTDAAPSASSDGYDWIALQRNAASKGKDAAVPMPLPTGEVSLDPLRDALLAQISKGAAQGVVEIIDGGLPPGDGNASDEGPWSRVSIGEMPGLKAGDDREHAGQMAADGKSCLTDKDLDVASWGLSGDIPAQFGLARSGMLTEFDAPVPDAVLRSVRFHIFLGFGVEARQYLGFIDGDRKEEVRLLGAMSFIVDEETAVDNPFDGMESCDSAAALWATLAHLSDGVPPLATNADAVARSFSALPAQMRQHLGGGLVDMFIASGDDETARKLRDAIRRMPVEGNPEVELMDARFHLSEGDEVTATHLAEGVMRDSGPATDEAAVTLVEAAFQGSHQIDPGLPLALDAFLHDAKGSNLVPALHRAKVLAAAMTGDFNVAFTEVKQAPDSFSDLWSLSAIAMPDDSFLEEAARYAVARPSTKATVRHDIAERLMGLGFPDLALSWLGPVGPGEGDDVRLMAAKAHIMLRNAPAVVDLLAGITSPEAETLRATAIAQLGDMKAAADALRQAGDETAGQRALTWTQDWSLVATDGPESWRAAASLLSAQGEGSPPGSIARGTELVKESAAARAKIEALLGSLVPPAPSQ